MLDALQMERVWAMPSRWTFTIPAIRDFIAQESWGRSVDPFAGESNVATYRNDICADQPSRLDALEFLATIPDNYADTVYYDPPYSPTQAKKYGRTEYSNKAYWSAVKKELARITKPGGRAICCGWNSGGLGKSNGFELYRVLLVAHGGNRNDTIVTAERKSWHVLDAQGGTT